MIYDEDQLLTISEAAKFKGISIQLFAYYLRREGAPETVYIGEHKHRFFRKDQVRAWQFPKKRGRRA